MQNLIPVIPTLEEQLKAGQQTHPERAELYAAAITAIGQLQDNRPQYALDEYARFAALADQMPFDMLTETARQHLKSRLGVGQ